MSWELTTATFNRNSSNNGLIVTVGGESGFPSDDGYDPALTCLQMVTSTASNPPNNHSMSNFPDEVRLREMELLIKIGTDRTNIDINERISDSAYHFDYGVGTGTKSHIRFRYGSSTSWWEVTSLNAAVTSGAVAAWRNYHLMDETSGAVYADYVNLVAFKDTTGYPTEQTWQVSATDFGGGSGWNTTDFSSAPAAGAGGSGDPHITTFGGDKYTL
jgi:hypothetical protein